MDDIKGDLQTHPKASDGISTIKEIGLKLSISTDAHTTGNLNFMKYEKRMARRVWPEKDDELNTRSWNDLNLKNC